MTEITRETLRAYLDDALPSSEMADVEKALRDSDDLRQQLRHALQERDRGEHTLGAIWRRARLTCPNRETLGSYLLGGLEKDEEEYLRFHLEEIQCPYCVANFTDLQNLQQSESPKDQERRRRYFKTSAGYLQQTRQ